MKAKIFVDQLQIGNNAATGECKPVLVVVAEDGRRPVRTTDVEICCPGCGEAVARVVYRPDQPVNGARVWIELEALEMETL